MQLSLSTSMTRSEQKHASAAAHFLSAFILLAAAIGCTPDGEKPPPVGTENGGGNGGSNGGGGTAAWDIGVVEGEGMGQQLVMTTTSDGRPAMAYFATASFADGPCDELGVTDPPDRIRWPLRYAEENGDGFTIETIDNILLVGSPSGIDLVRNPSGNPALATMGGPAGDQPNFCGAGDVVVYTRGGADNWTMDTLVTTSGQAATGEAASDYGGVVGTWASIAYGSGGQAAVAYQDIHGGGLQSDDKRRADLEVALSNGGGWNPTPVDWGRGAGDFTDVTFDAQGRIVILYHNPTDDVNFSAHGVWAARSADNGATWEQIHLKIGSTSERPNLLVDPTSGTLYVALYDAGVGVPIVMTLDNPEDFENYDSWSEEDIGDHRYDEGYHPRMALDPDGRLSLVYYRCARAADGLGNCDVNDDAIVYAWRELDGTWYREVVDAGGSGQCGNNPNLVYDNDNKPVVSYQCSETVDGAFQFRVKMARRRNLP
jgi:hypothetical protein